nr:nitrite/sulfite reductase [Acidiferrobacterales bacterium]
MYQYSQSERQLLEARAEQFANQVHRYKDGEIHPDIFRQLRLRNGLYEERYSPMLRIAIPYGELGSQQLRALAEIADRFDKGYGHFTTRQNFQFNWPKLNQVPAILRRLADVDMHAIQTSGSCIRNITTDYLAGVAQDEIEDTRPWCELLRQWSTLHPEFNWLPRKFKFAVSGAKEDRALIRLHDVGIQINHTEAGTPNFRIFVGGGMGRTPVIGKEL